MTEFIDAILQEAEEQKQTGVRVQEVKAAVAQLRELEQTRVGRGERLTAVKNRISELTEVELVKLFMEANVTSMTIEADGNYPAVKAERVNFYSAKIPEDREAEAFDWFEREGHGDLVKSVITVPFGMRELEQAKKLAEKLTAAGYDYNSKLGVHHTTLKAFVKSELEAGRTLPMDLLGAYQGEIVKLKTIKGK